MKRRLPVALLALLPFAQAQYRIPRYAPVPVSPVPPDVPVADSDPNFPLRVHIVTTRWGGLANRNHGFGTGNLLDASHPQGFNFGFACDYPFVENQVPSDTYQARWKRSPYQLEILTGEVGGKHIHTCALHLALEAKPFDAANAVRFAHGVSSSLHVPWQDPDFAYEEADADYPVQFHVLDAQRTEDMSGDHGWGTANLIDPAPGVAPAGAEFRYDCGHGFLANTQIATYYQGHWVKPGEKLEILLQRAGSEKVDKCTVTVALRPYLYPQRGTRVQRVGTASASPTP